MQAALGLNRPGRADDHRRSQGQGARDHRPATGGETIARLKGGTFEVVAESWYKRHVVGNGLGRNPGGRPPQVLKTSTNPPAPVPFPNAAEPENADANTLYCSFCGKDQHNVRQLIAAAAKIFICDEYVDLCATMVREKREGKARNGNEWVPV